MSASNVRVMLWYVCVYISYPIMMLTYYTFTASLEKYLVDAGFKEINLNLKEESRAIISQWLPGSGAEEFVISAEITARK